EGAARDRSRVVVRDLEVDELDRVRGRRRVVRAARRRGDLLEERPIGAGPESDRVDRDVVRLRPCRLEAGLRVAGGLVRAAGGLAVRQEEDRPRMTSEAVADELIVRHYGRGPDIRSPGRVD